MVLLSLHRVVKLEVGQDLVVRGRSLNPKSCGVVVDEGLVLLEPKWVHLEVRRHGRQLEPLGSAIVL